MTFCQRCAQIDFRSYFDRNTLFGPQQLRELRAVRDLQPTSCAFCSLLAYAVAHCSVPDGYTDLVIRLGGRCESQHGHSPVIRAKDGTITGKKNTWAPKELSFRLHGFNAATDKYGKLLHEPVELPVHFLPLVPKDFVTVRGGNELENEIREDQQDYARLFDHEYVDITLVKRWISVCRTLHLGGCLSRHNTQSGKQLPDRFRLIDVRNNCIVEVGGNHDLPYLALSYVWSTLPNQSRLTRKNHTTWLKPGALLSPELNFSLTIMDAMSFARILRQTYLWIDALCIMQDDDIDKQAQIKSMGSIYASAYLTVVAATDTDQASLGLLGLPGRPRHGIPQFVADLGDLSIATIEADQYMELERSKWYTRGWTMQEKLCARRALIFTPSKVLFWCARAVYREEVHSEHPKFDRARIRGAMNSLHRVQRSPAEVFKEVYTKVLRDYLTRRLSYSDDIINAFTGIGELLTPYMGHFHYGLPDRHFQQALSWSHRTPFEPRRGFPSWSWAGWYHDTEKMNRAMYYDDGVSSEPENVVTDLNIFRLKEQRLEILGDRENIAVEESEEYETINQICSLMRAGNLKGTELDQLIIFVTEVAELELRQSVYEKLDWVYPKLNWHDVIDPQNGKKLGQIILDTTWMRSNVAAATSKHEFCYISQYGVFCLLLLVHRVDGIAYRVQMSEQIERDQWLACHRRKEVIILG